MKVKVINILIHENTKEIEIVSPMPTAEAMKIIKEIAGITGKGDHMISKESEDLN
jgi:hypothetical protein